MLADAFIVPANGLAVVAEGLAVVQAGEVRAEDARAACNDPASLSMYMAKPDR